jgi:hypothetical protein
MQNTCHIQTRLKMHSVLYPREPRLLMQTWLLVCHYKTALSRLQVYRPTAAISAAVRAGVQITRLPAYGRIILPPRCMHTRTATWELQWQVIKLHVCAWRCPAAAAGSQTAVTVMQWQDTKLQAQKCALLSCCSGRIPNCMRSGSFTNCLIE